MTRFTTCLLLVCLPLLALPASADDRRSARPLDERALRGTYVFAGRVLLNPVVPQGPQQQQPPQRLPVDCFSIGELRFDGRGGVKRRVEIRCPATANLLSTGLGAPPPLFEPTPQQIDVMGTTLTTRGKYHIGADGWGRFSEQGTARLGPLPGNPASLAGRIALRKMRGGVAQEIVFLIDHQSLQGPGAPGLINSDIGASFVARRR